MRPELRPRFDRVGTGPDRGALLFVVNRDAVVDSRGDCAGAEAVAQCLQVVVTDYDDRARSIGWLPKRQKALCPEYARGMPSAGP